MSFEGFAWIGSNAYAFPVLEVLHILGIALLVGNLVLLELRILGVLDGVALLALQRVTLRLALVGFVLVVASGITMFLSQPQELLANAAFKVKLGLLAVAGINAGWFHARGVVVGGIARAQVILSMFLWVAVITAGRWIGYV
ncbi:MAG: hypothetical protein RIS44_3085 [Pseudomonadota bacterium]|jgi:hypothetical protein